MTRTVLACVLLSGTSVGCSDPSPAARDAGRSAAARKAPAKDLPLRGRDLPVPKKTVRFDAQGVEVVGWLWRGREPAAPAVVLVHQLGSDRREWEPFALRLRAQGDLHVLAIDLRGHGESVHGPQKAISWTTFAASDWPGVVEDVRAAIRWLQEGSGLRPSKIGVVGSSIGSSAALLAAVDDATVAAAILLSPGLSYRGLDTLPALPRWGRRPLLLLAGEGDADSARAVESLAQAASRADRHVYPGVDGHGVRLAGDAPDLYPRMALWLAGKLGISRASSAAPSR